ncbi:MAG: hypothetical protein HYR72_24750 [Deltaproteobacteria bacterium]|nr:hypothetical protein [Deltaproteobacteria bacterium]
MQCVDYLAMAAADIDGRLTVDEERDVESHVSSCAHCAAVRQQQRTIKQLVRERAAHVPTPAGVRARVLQALAREGAGSKIRRRWLSPVRLTLAGGIAALAMLTVHIWWQPVQPDLLTSLARDTHAAAADHIALAIRTGNVDDLRRYYRSTGKIGFERSADDLSAWGLRLVGGTVARLGDIDATLTVYEGAAGRVVCRRFRPGSIRLPEGGEWIGDNQFFTIDGVTVCLMRLGDVICCLTTTMARADFVERLTAPKHM